MDQEYSYPIPRTLARNRAGRVEKIGPKKKYSRYLPKYPNKILIWLSKNKPEYAITGHAMNSNLRSSLLKVSISPTTYKRILLNESIMTTDELQDIAKIIGAKAIDII